LDQPVPEARPGALDHLIDRHRNRVEAGDVVTVVRDAVKGGGGRDLRQRQMYAIHLVERHLEVLEADKFQLVAERSHEQLLIQAIRIRKARGVDVLRTNEQVRGAGSQYVNVRQRIVGQPGVVLVLSEDRRDFRILAKIGLPVVIGDSAELLVACLAVGRGWRLRGHSGKEWQQRQRRHKSPRVIRAAGSIHSRDLRSCTT